MSYPIGNAPTSWGIERPADPAYPKWSTFLDQVAEAGYQGTELGPYGYLPIDASVLRAELDRRRLKLTAGYVIGALHDRTKTQELVEQARRVCRLLHALGASHLVLIAGLFPDRTATAGRSSAAPRLADHDFSTLCRTIATIADIASADGLTAGIHPHAGTYIEFRDEIDEVMEAVASYPLGLVVDTGHCAYAGIDPAALIRAYSGRITYVHLKDVNPQVREQAARKKLDFWQAYGAGIFCVLGRGVNDFRAVRDCLKTIGYSGWLTVEQDADPLGKSEPVADAKESLAYLREVGLAS